MRTRYVQRGALWVPETRPIQGVGDALAWGLKKLGLESRAGCGCARRRAALNRWLPFRNESVGPVVHRAREPWPPISGGVAGEEIRCTELDAQYGAGTCICSEPLNTTTYTEVLDSHWSAGDSTRKCAIFDVTGAVVVRSDPADFGGSNNATIFSALPAGADVQWVFKQVDNFSTQGMFVGGNFPDAAPTGRRAVRGYVYFSPDFAFAECPNSGKVFDFTLQGPTLSNNGNWNLYAWDPNWSIGAYDCCGEGPGSQAGAQDALSHANVRGKWHRIEGVETNIAGTPARLRIYWANVTDGGPEWTVVDTSIPTVQGQGQNWTSTQATTLTNVAGRDEVFFNLFRWDGDNPATPCTGYFAMSHVLMAAWNTDADQRIGAATEIEGGGAPTPSTDTGVRRAASRGGIYRTNYR